jgi:ATP-dependent helicase HepA
MKYQIGQRWVSLTEPELGPAIITEVLAKTISVSFPNSEGMRTYGFKSAPLKRLSFEEGDKVETLEGTSFLISARVEQDGLFFYMDADENILCETQLTYEMNHNRPEEKLFTGHTDAHELFLLRHKTHELKKMYQQFSSKGLMGPRVSLLDHQIYLANKISQSLHPRVLLSDEVGLGKTIEAGLLIHHAILNDKAKRVLIILPSSLNYQWFVEMLRKFNLVFAVVNEQTPLESGVNPFLENHLVIASINLLKGAAKARELLDQVEWDLVVADEVHKYQQSNSVEEGTIGEFEILRSLTNRIPSVFLLTATPMQAGEFEHFRRLQLLDPNRFSDFDKFQEEQKDYSVIAKLVEKIENNETDNKDKKKIQELIKEENLPPQDTIKKLLDLFGTGRIFYRNTRQQMDQEFSFFKERILHPYALKTSKGTKETKNYQTKLAWFVDFLHQHPNDKVLLIGKLKNEILKLEKDIAKISATIKVGTFHSDLSLMARDRQAAYFSEPDGSQVLLCTEIGSEGRNFEFSHHLVLFDIPEDPELLEQRIGRLDRIGQTKDINIHVPYIEGGREEFFFRWYDEGLEAFKSATQGGDEIKSTLEKSIELIEDSKNWDKIISQTKENYLEVQTKLAAGRNRLVELNSFDPVKSKSLVKEIRKFEDNTILCDYLESVFQLFGVDSDEIGGDSYFISPGNNMFIPSFPNLPSDGLGFTYDRTEALEREDRKFMSWDYPMVSGAMDLILSQQFGSFTTCSWKSEATSKVIFECFFSIEAVAPQELRPMIFFPPTLIRVLIDSKENIFTDKYSKEDMDEKITTARSKSVARADKFPKDGVKKVLATANVEAIKLSEQVITQALESMQRHYNTEISRLEHLKRLDSPVSELEIDGWNHHLQILTESFKKATPQLDSIRLIL